MEGGVIMETELFTVRYPETNEEVLAQERVIAEARADNPLLKVNGVSQAAIDGLFSSSRDWEVSRR